MGIETIVHYPKVDQLIHVVFIVITMVGLLGYARKKIREEGEKKMMVYSNNSIGAIIACERARTGNYGLDEEDYDYDYIEDDEVEDYDEEDDED